MDTEKRLEIIKEVGEEIITEDELRVLLETKEHPIAYDGFEPSGNLHIAQGLMRAINIEKMLKAGCHFKMLVADWHAWANNKFGGDLDKIQTTGKYIIEVWKACGLETEKIEFIWASDLNREQDYWKTVMRIATNNSLNRMVRCCQIMGRKETDSLTASQILYPCMQAADIFELKADITQLGMDQRKVNMLAREIGPKIGFYKPVAVHHHMLMGLVAPPACDETTSKIDRVCDLKMSKSKPDSAIFMTDSEKDIMRKISKAYCPEKIIDENPVLEYCRHIVFERFKTIEIERLAKFGGNVTLNSYDELVKMYQEGGLHPMDLKTAVAKSVNELIAPVREHFEKNKKAHELLAQVMSFGAAK